MSRPGGALAAVALVGALALAGCTATGGGSTGGGRPDGSAGADAQRPAPDVPHLVAEGLVFDPVADDVGGTEVCDGIAGRETLEVFDRAAWPELDVPAGDGVLRCGNASGAGWRHIADGHTSDFGELADLVDAGWEDVAWFAIDRALEQPTRVEEYRGDIVNYDVLVEYVDGGSVERAWMVTVGVALDDGTIITSFPDEQRRR